MIKIESVTHYDEFTGAGGGGVPYQNGNILNRYQTWIDFYSYLAFENKFLRFTESTKTIENIDEIDFDDFRDDGDLKGRGLAAGRLITVTGTDDNDGNYTIASISEDGRTITVVEALTDEDAEDANIYDATPVTAVDFYYNLIPNNEQASYLSLTDTGSIQRFSGQDLEAGNTSPAAMLITSGSFAWVTNEITDEIIGETDEVTIEGRDTVDFRQQFRIKQYWHIAPYWTNAQLVNFQNGTLPDYFQGGNSLKYITRIDGKLTFTEVVPAHTGEQADALGRTCWFDQNNIRSRVEYYIDSITYTDPDTNTVDKPDIEKITDVSVTIKSRSGKFVTLLSKFVLDFFYCPLNDNRYVFTPDTTLKQNLLNDRKLLLLGQTANGENNGTAYQVLKNITGNFIDAETIRVDFKINFATEIKDFLKTLPEENRQFAISVTTQDVAITETEQSDRVAVLCDFNAVGWDKSTPDLVEAVDNIRIYSFPNIDFDPRVTVSGWEGDPIYAQFPFLFDITQVDGESPTILNCGFQIVAFKEGEEDFVLDEKIFDTSFVRKLEGVQTIDFSESRNFDDMPDEFNTSSIRREEIFDISNQRGFMASHAFILDYEFWAKLISDGERNKYPIFEEIESPTRAWNTIQESGWSVKIRFKVEVEGGNGFIETFDQYWDINCKALGEEPDEPPISTLAIKYEQLDNGFETDGISAATKTLITATYTGDYSTYPDSLTSPFAYIFADVENTGGLTTRRFASTEFNSGENSPFIAPDAPVTDATQSWASENMRINIIGDTKIVAQTIYDESISNWQYRTPNILIFPRLGFYSSCFILTEEGGYMLNENGQRIRLEVCEPLSS